MQKRTSITILRGLKNGFIAKFYEGYLDRQTPEEVRYEQRLKRWVNHNKYENFSPNINNDNPLSQVEVSILL